MNLSFTKIFLSSLSLLVILFLVLVTIGKNESDSHEKAIAQRFLLTDICLSTESRHTRNITLIEPVAAFQDAPGFYDHFPSSTFLRPDSIYLPNKSKPTLEH